jgi:hypothetical protein
MHENQEGVISGDALHLDLRFRFVGFIRSVYRVI